MSGDILTVKTVKRVRSVRGSALVHISVSEIMRIKSVAVQNTRISTCICSVLLVHLNKLIVYNKPSSCDNRNL